MNTQVSGPVVKPEADAYYCEVPSQPCVIVMFGASGDLAQRKLLPALYDLAFHACLAPRFRLVGFSRTKMDDAEFQNKSGEAQSKAKAASDADGDSLMAAADGDGKDGKDAKASSSASDLQFLDKARHASWNFFRR